MKKQEFLETIEKDTTLENFIESQEKLVKTYEDEIEKLKEEIKFLRAEDSIMTDTVGQLTDYLMLQFNQGRYLGRDDINVIVKSLLGAADPQLTTCDDESKEYCLCQPCKRDRFLKYNPISTTWQANPDRNRFIRRFNLT